MDFQLTANITGIPFQPNQTESELYIDYVDFSQDGLVRMVFVAIYIVIIIMAIIGNGFVLLTLSRQQKIESSFDLLLYSMAASDLMVGAFVAPGKLLELSATADLRFFGNAICTCLQFGQSLTIFITIVTLLVVSGERYLVIVHPLHSRRWEKVHRMRLLLLISWLSAFILSAPYLLPAQQLTAYLKSSWGSIDRAFCTDKFDDLLHPNFRQIYFLFLFVVLYVLPGIVIATFNARVVITLYSRQSLDMAISLDSIRDNGSIRSSISLDQAFKKQLENRRRVAVMMVTINIASLVCWSPYFVTTIFTQFGWNFLNDSNFYFTMLTINAFGFCNSAVNPIIYLMAPSFRRNYRLTISRVFGCSGKLGQKLSLTEARHLSRHSSYQHNLQPSLHSSFRYRDKFSTESSSDYYNSIQLFDTGRFFRFSYSARSTFPQKCLTPANSIRSFQSTSLYQNGHYKRYGTHGSHRSVDSTETSSLTNIPRNNSGRLLALPYSINGQCYEVVTPRANLQKYQPTKPGLRQSKSTTTKASFVCQSSEERENSHCHIDLTAENSPIVNETSFDGGPGPEQKNPRSRSNTLQRSLSVQ